MGIFRRSLMELLVVIVSLCAIVVPRTASADAAPERADLRADMVAGHGDDALATIAARLAADISPTERAALLELFDIGTRWDWKSPPCVASPPGDGVATGQDWNAALEGVRGDLAQGAFGRAYDQSNALVSRSKTILDAARAVELRSLASAGRKCAPKVVEAPSPAELPPLFSTASEHAKRPPEARWYGWQNLIADGAALVTAPFAPLAGFGLYVTGGPVVHLAHGEGVHAAGSLGLRLGAPVVLGAGGYALGAASSREGKEQESAGLLALAGIVMGTVTAVIVDSAVLAYEPATSPKESSTASASIWPTAAPRKEGGVELGLQGTW